MDSEAGIVETARRIRARRRIAVRGVENSVRAAAEEVIVRFDSPALRKLAGLVSPARFDARPLFETTAAELKLHLPISREAILRGYLLAQSLLDGADPDDVLMRVHRDVLGPLNHPADLMPWCYLSAHLHPQTFDDLNKTQVSEEARALARKTIPER
jgi:hypothetical protein